MYVQVVKVRLQPDTSCGLARHHRGKQLVHQSIRAKCVAGAFQSVVFEKYCPDIVPIVHGWEKDEASKSLLPVTVPESAALAHMGVIKLIWCSFGNIPAMRK